MREIELEANGKKLITNTFQIIQWKHALRLEEKGMTGSRGSVTAHLKKRLGFPRGTKRKVLIDLVEAAIKEVERAT